MLDEVLRWAGAGDQAITAMGPTVAIALALLGGFGVTQFLKFLIAEFVTDRWRAFVIRLVAVVSTWCFAHSIGGLPTGVELVVAFSTLFVYWLVQTTLWHYFPWLEAGKIVGSAVPSNDAVQARVDRKGP